MNGQLLIQAKDIEEYDTGATEWYEAKSFKVSGVRSCDSQRLTNRSAVYAVAITTSAGPSLSTTMGS